MENTHYPPPPPPPPPPHHTHTHILPSLGFGCASVIDLHVHTGSDCRARRKTNVQKKKMLAKLLITELLTNTC